MEKFSIDISKLNLNIRSQLIGKMDENLKLIENAFDIKINLKADNLIIYGKADIFEKVDILFKNLIEFLYKKRKLNKRDIEYDIKLVKKGETSLLTDLIDETIVYTITGRPIKAKTIGQKIYLDSIKNNDIAFGIGPAGTGKTYLAVASAIRSFKNKEVNRIILTRPAVEAGESLGFLPGDLQMKVDPYLRPLYDGLFDILGYETYLKYVEKGLIEIAPLAYMRGRTLDNAFVILDEAQNTTNEQMKMFLTRLGYGSKAIINGDITQIDLPYKKESGLKRVLKILQNINGIGITFLDNEDIVRHPLIQKIIEAYKKDDEKDKNEKIRDKNEKIQRNK